MLARTIAGKRAGIVAFSLSAFAPEPWFACEVPNHNIPGTFYTLGGITALVIGFKRWEKNESSFGSIALLAVLGGILIGLADIQR